MHYKNENLINFEDQRSSHWKDSHIPDKTSVYGKSTHSILYYHSF